jgi:hypothetical protein
MFEPAGPGGVPSSRQVLSVGRAIMAPVTIRYRTMTARSQKDEW